ncbi:MAG: DUF115 domain-containing protein [bacterium]|nr:DUF115 domain-containing protein [bacterium]
MVHRYPDHYFICIETEMTLFRTFLDTAPAELLTHPRIYYFTDKDMDRVQNLISYLHLIRIKQDIKFRIFKYIPLTGLFREKYDSIETSLLQEFTTFYSNILTERNFRELWQRNIRKNSASLLHVRKLLELKNSLSGKPLIIASAGPSLEKNMDFIRTSRDRMVLVSVDTALRYLMKHGIEPDYVLSLDAKYENLNDFKFLDFPDPVRLVFDIISFPRITKFFREKFVTYTYKLIRDFQADGFQKYYDDDIRPLIEQYGDFGGLQSGGSVSTNALDLALFLDADPVYLVGLDLNYVNYKTHCRGTYKELYYLSRMNKFYNYETLNFTFVVQRENIREVKGNDVYHHDFILRKYKKWFEDALELIKDKKKIVVV